MPEDNETTGHVILFKLRLEEKQGKTSFRLLGIWSDASKAEETRLSARSGHVKRLSEKSNIFRGTQGSQTALWPTQFSASASHPTLEPITDLNLIHGHRANRAIILEFQSSQHPYFFKCAFLTHTSIQFYERNVWEKSIMGVNKKNRGFHVGIAFEFEEFFIAFVTNDLLFQPIWGLSLEKLMGGYINPRDDYQRFLEIVAHWIDDRASGPRKCLVSDVIRDSPEVWFGIGVYTVCEVLYMAGVSPFLTEMEVFDNPSRTARICEAFWAFEHKGKTDLPALIRPCMREGLLAPSQAQRLTYKNWLHVYAKSRAAVTQRMATLIDLYQNTLNERANCDTPWYRHLVEDGSPVLFDVFEPNYVRHAFELKDTHLGPLIFGFDGWNRYGLSPGKPNALTAMFAREGLLDEPTYLSKDVYGDLYAPYGPTIWRQRSTFTHYTSKQVWSITSAFPNNCGILSGVKHPARDISQVTGAQRSAMLFDKIVSQTRGVAIGPLEYCGNAKVIHKPHGETIVSAVRFDPLVPATYAKREALGLQRRGDHLDRRGSAKKAMPRSKQSKRRRILNQHNLLSSSPDPLTISTPTSTPQGKTENVPPNPPPAKRRRISADKALVVSIVGTDNIGSICIGRHKKRV